MFQKLSRFPISQYPLLFYHFYPNCALQHFKDPQISAIDREQVKTQNVEDQQNQQSQKLTLTKEDFQVEGIGICKKHWSEEQDLALKKYSQLYNFDWTQICKHLPGRNQKMCYSRYRRVQNQIKAHWTTKQNQDIKKYFQVDKMSWKVISTFFPNRTAKQIRQHYLNFLRPNIKKDRWTVEEDIRIVQMYNQFGKKWKMFQKYFEGRTQNQIKNRFYGRLKRLQRKKEDLESNHS